MLEQRIQEFKKIDLTILSIFAIVAEVISNIAFVNLGSNFYLNLSLMIGIISIIRWGIIGFIPYLMAGIAFMFIKTGIDGYNYLFLFYPLINCSLVFIGLMFKFIKKEKVVNNNIWLSIYIILAYIIVSITRGVYLYFVNNQNTLLIEIYHEFISQLFQITIVIIFMFIIKNQSELLIDQPKYFRNVAEERE